MKTKFQLIVVALLVSGLVAPVVAQDDKKKDEKKVEVKAKDDKDKKKVKPHSGPIVEFKKISVEKKAFEDATAKRPIVIKTEKEAKKYFNKETLAKVKKVVDFDARHILIFAWRGSGRDKLDYVVMESFPEQIACTYTRGRTRDLRSHVRVFSVRKNVKVMVRQ